LSLDSRQFFLLSNPTAATEAYTLFLTTAAVRMRPEIVKAELCVKVNFNLSCGDFLTYVEGQKCLLKASQSEQKYSFKRK